MYENLNIKPYDVHSADGEWLFRVTTKFVLAQLLNLDRLAIERIETQLLERHGACELFAGSHNRLFGNHKSLIIKNALIQR